MASNRIEKLESEINDLREQLLNHPIYQSIDSPAALRVFMEHHCFAVWDFMCLLKFLQQKLTCTSVQWYPTKDDATRRLVNDIVMGEESDETQDGGFASHYGLYKSAMEQCGATTATVGIFISMIGEGLDYKDAMNAVGAPDSIKNFVNKTFDIIATDDVVQVASAFTFGREDLIPDMFGRIVSDINDQTAGQFDQFMYYLDRHIELDAEEHGPMALKMIDNLCQDSDENWKNATEAAKTALKARLVFWDDIHTAIKVNAAATA